MNEGNKIHFKPRRLKIQPQPLIVLTYIDTSFVSQMSTGGGNDLPSDKYWEGNCDVKDTLL